MSFIPPVINVTASITGTDEIRAKFKDAGSKVRKRVHGLLGYLATDVARAANAAAPRRTKGRLSKAIGFRYALGRSGYKKDDTERVVIRALKFKDIVYAAEFGQLGKAKGVEAHKRRFPRVAVKADGRRVGRKIRGGSVQVAAYRRRFTQKAKPYLGPAFDSMRARIMEDLDAGVAVAMKHAIEEGT